MGGSAPTVKVLEVGQLDALAHAEQVACRAEAVDQHPHVSRIERRNRLVGARGRMAVGLERMADVGPCGDDGGQNHQPEGEERHAGDCAAEPQHLTVRDQDDGQVLKDGVHGDGEVFDGPSGGVDHADEQKGNGKPFLCFVRVEVAVGDYAHALEGFDCDYADRGLDVY